MEDTHGGREAGRVMARMIGAVVKQGESKMQRALSSALEASKTELPVLIKGLDTPLTEIEIPEPLRQYAIESANAADFDQLLACEVSP